MRKFLIGTAAAAAMVSVAGPAAAQSYYSPYAYSYGNYGYSYPSYSYSRPSYSYTYSYPGYQRYGVSNRVYAYSGYQHRRHHRRDREWSRDREWNPDRDRD